MKTIVGDAYPLPPLVTVTPVICPPTNVAVASAPVPFGSTIFTVGWLVYPLPGVDTVIAVTTPAAKVTEAVAS